MRDNDSTSLSQPDSTTTMSTGSQELLIPPTLKFILSNIKNLIPYTLTVENYMLWRTQIYQHLSANGYADYLTGIAEAPPETLSADLAKWRLVDTNLMSALFSTISQTILPYVINATSAHEVWTVLEKRLQASSRSRILQLKNELHHIQMQTLTMQQYLAKIKQLVDSIAASGTKLDPEDIILYTLNGLPAQYNSIKTYIRSSSLPADLDSLYSLLCNEELHINQDLKKEPSQLPVALYTNKYNPNRSKNSKRTSQYRSNNNNRSTSGTDQPATSNAGPNISNNQRPTCQICGKSGHTAITCWHRCNMNYNSNPNPTPRANLAQSTQEGGQSWILDSGATTHMTSAGTILQNSNVYQGSDSVSTANGSTMSIQNYGQGLLPLPNTPRKLHLCHLLHVPALTHNLLSVSKLTNDNAISITFDSNGFHVKDLQDHQILLHGRLHNGVYELQLAPDRNLRALHTTTPTPITWHARLGHPNHQIFNFLASSNSGFNKISSDFCCISCQSAKSHKQKFCNSNSETKKQFELIHSDLWGPVPQSEHSTFRYYVIFIDDFTRYCWIYFMNSKSETINCFKSFLSLIKTQFDCTPKRFRSDGGGEFTSTAFLSILQAHGILHQISCPHTPEQNGLAERKHRHLLDITRTLLHAANLPDKFWLEAIATANYLINRLPSKPLSLKSPYQMLYNATPDYSHLRTFGCLCFPWLQPYTHNKFEPRSQPCLFLGYSPNHKGYKCFNLSNNKIHISRHVQFYENIFPLHNKSTSDSLSSPLISSVTPPLLLMPTSTISTATDPSHKTNSDPPITTAPSHSTNDQTHQLSSSPEPRHNSAHPFHPMQTRSKSGITKPKQLLSLLSNSDPLQTPTTYKQASKNKIWQDAMNNEYQALLKQQTWTLVQKPANKPVIGCKWTYKIKQLPNGQIDRYKARLVALGYAQIFGQNYNETFSPVAKMVTIRLLLNLAINHNWPML
ncbi:Retrovirus-related Pol polyprotein from transposon TNT 1-94 [Dendrobium catenatum]|uniref:Retrovirus-related Pol polyprotein from transposon TNT 1-94 n=1 Tax=Dendrobium catenatum TaxID=906689 RepID=A0A2I0WMF3_9ASPA|nr:Retrovirus-related Pol polyprotein from transposon TNT 1-94 [Dendrobium catenatum]